MLGNAKATRSTIDARRCLACGYGGRFAQASPHDDRRAMANECPRCGCDFRVRPPRSYAEMEGLDLDDGRHAAARAYRRHAATAGAPRMTERWLAFLCMTFLIVVAVASLVVALLAPFGPFAPFGR